MEKVSYQGWQNCVRLSNDEVELIAPTEIGAADYPLWFHWRRK